MIRENNTVAIHQAVQNPDIPETWASSPLGDIIEDSMIGLVRNSSEQNTEGRGIPYIKMNNIDMGGNVQCSDNVFVQVSAEELSKFSLRRGDILFNTRNSYELVGKTGIVKEIDGDKVFNNNLMRLRLSECLDSRFACYQMVSSQFRKHLEKAKRATTNICAIYGKDLFPIHLIIPPLPEQHRIVNKIEELFTQLDAGVELLQKTKVLLNQYRQSVLKAAFEGKLTEEWRGKWDINNPWEHQMLKEVCVKIQDGTHFSPKIQHDAPGENRFLYITAKNIKETGINLSNVTYVDKSFHDNIYRRCNPEYGDVLLVKDGVTTGTVTINQLREPFSLLSSVALLKVKRELINPVFMKFFLMSPLGYKMITGSMTGTAIRRIILERIKDCMIPIPVIQEQNEIVSQIDKCFSYADNLKNAISSCLDRERVLRRKILSNAFQGKLVPQDPTDEPASKLLERIKADRSGEAPRGRKPRQTKMF